MARSQYYFEDYNTGRAIIDVWCVDATDGVTPETGEAGGQPQLSKNGAAFANTTNTLTASDSTKGLYKLQLAAADLSAIGNFRLVYKSSNTAVFDTSFEVVPNPFLHDGTAQAGTTSTITLASGADATNDNAYDNGVIWIYDGTGANQMRGISSYASGTLVATVDQDWTTTPDSTSKYVVLPSPKPVASTDFADALLGRNIAGGSSSGRTVKEALYALRNKVALSSITSTTATMTVYGTDDTTSAWTSSVTLASGTNPITSSDPA